CRTPHEAACMDDPHRQGVRVRTSSIRQAVKAALPRWWLALPCARTPWTSKNKDGTLLSRTLKNLFTKGMCRHADIILRCASEFVFFAATASLLVAGRVGCRPQVFQELGSQMAQTLRRRPGRRPAPGGGLARSLPRPQDPTPSNPSVGGRAGARHSRSAPRRPAPRARSRSDPLLPPTRSPAAVLSVARSVVQDHLSSSQKPSAYPRAWPALPSVLGAASAHDGLANRLQRYLQCAR